MSTRDCSWSLLFLAAKKANTVNPRRTIVAEILRLFGMAPHPKNSNASLRDSYKSSLLAGRGEIAIHILRTAQELEWSAVAVYTAQGTGNATVADEAVKLDDLWYALRSPLLPTPGRPHGIFIGSAPETLRTAGTRYSPNLQQICMRLLSGVRYPVMMKALDGGSGRGIRVVSAQEGVEEALKRCAGETQSGRFPSQKALSGPE
ncbi:hypothetical protein FIBSPDRAFT_958320 [Athelia psychrophila]|uniref:ATP-grasp domain-containing protein n=1 Tax=Athelia psychrophila TaxID=1759441 RepID=A0A166EPB8_9AGAM|nr:hypothetical protein FIBSPDRAFT_958320 [Fibularhizoctonia sp. CBS 109695]